MKGRIVTESGNISIDMDVITRYAGLIAIECFGVVGMAALSMRDDLAKLLKKESLTKGIELTIKDEGLCIDYHVIISYGVSIATVAENLIHNVTYKLEKFTGIPVNEINVYVEGVQIID